MGLNNEAIRSVPMVGTGAQAVRVEGWVTIARRPTQLLTAALRLVPVEDRLGGRSPAGPILWNCATRTRHP